MKKIIILTLVPILIFAGSIIFIISVSYNNIQYENDTYFHVMGAMEDEKAVAEFDGQMTILLGANLKKISGLLTPSELKRKFFCPEFEDNDGIILSFPDGAKYVVVEDSKSEDGVYIKYTYGKKKLMFWIEGYNTYGWLIKATSPDGIYGENELVVED